MNVRSNGMLWLMLFFNSGADDRLWRRVRVRVWWIER